MQHVPPHDHAQQEWTHRLVVDLGRHADNLSLKTHIDAFIQLSLQDRASLRFIPLGTLDYGLIVQAGSAEDFQALGRELESQLFGPDEPGQIQIIPRPVSSQVTSLDQFRDDIRTIARSMHGGQDLRKTMKAFQTELKSVSAEFREDLSEAVHSIQDAAERVEMASALIPDPDRFELLMARNEASTVILERGVRQALELILEAVDGMAARGVMPGRAISDQSAADEPE